MPDSDRDLGMDRSITRRDFLNGVSVAVGGTMMKPTSAGAEEALQQPPAAAMAEADYPPAWTGLRGSNAASMEAAHAMRDGKRWDTGEDTGETYDLVVVGGGMSGLAAAYYFRKKTVPDAKILILDNHDDFGGHARRNEFTVDGKLLIVRGGASYIERPATYTAEGRELLQEIGIDYYDPRYKTDQGFYRSVGLTGGTYFDRETFGTDLLVKGLRYTPEVLAKTPLSARVQQDLIRLRTDKSDYLAGLSKEEKIQKLRKTSYKDYLIDVVKVHPDLLKFYHPMGQPAALITETTSAWWSFNWGYPGFDGLGLEKAPDARVNLDKNRPNQNEPTSFHFPEGLAGVARLIVRSLVPEALPARSMADAQLVQVRYARLDDPASPVRMRLSSTVVRVRNNNANPADANEVEVVYVRDGKAQTVRAKGCVLACYNAAIPYMVPELPDTQKEALSKAVRAVFMRTQVAIRNWKAFETLGVSGISCPGTSYPGYGTLGLNTPVTMGDYHYPDNPDEPIVVLLGGGVEFKYTPGMTAREMFRATRQALYETSFEQFEQRIRTHMGRVLGDGGFDPARDIAGITLNRWGHGYAMGQNLLFDPDWTEDEYPWVVGRKRFGRITIANSDAEGVCLTQAAFDMAHRAVDELMKRQTAWWNRI